MPDSDQRRIFGDTDMVDVIVPVYRGLEATRRCVESVLRADCATRFELILIDDASPEAELTAYCESLRGRPGVSIVRNPRNLGFVTSVNRGMGLHPGRDVVLLNSDTEVANDWLDRLRRCVHGSPDIATATPFSNNATICSYPRFCDENALPPAGLGELDRVFAQVNAGEHLDLPTAVGFCMYIRRACLDQVGLFDAGEFGRGYGEENDFSRRAAKAGWRNLLCADTFVFHAGGVSFGDERAALLPAAAAAMARLHPEYAAAVQAFVAADPPARLRQAVDMELARRRMGLPAASAAGAGKPVQLHLIHDLGGGVGRWCRDYCEADANRVNLVLKPLRRSPAMGDGLMLFAAPDESVPLRYWRLQTPIAATAETHPEYRQVLESIVHDYGVDAILVSSLIGHSLDALDTGLPTLLVQHDYYPYCAAIHSFFEGVCQRCDAARLTRCAEHNPSFNPAHALFPADERLRVRRRYLELANRNNITLVVPSQSARAHFNRLVPEIDPTRFVTIPHGCLPVLQPVPYTSGDPHEKLRIVVLGMLSASKGVDLLLAGLDALLELAELHLVGAGEMGAMFEGRAGVHVVDGYAVEDLPSLLSAIRPHAGLLLSTVPETFSYTLSELFMLGIPPLATDLGGFAERIVPGRTGFLFTPDVTGMLASVREVHGDREKLQQVRANLLLRETRTASEMVADYHRLLPLAGRRAGAPSPPAPDAAARERMAQALALSRQWKENQRLRATLEIKSGRLRAAARGSQEWHARLAALEHARDAAQAALQDAAQSLAAREADVRALRASTSWRVTVPLRWVARCLRQGRMLARCLRPLLSQPRRAPARFAALLHSWRSEGVGGVKRVLLQLAQGGMPPVEFHPLEGEAASTPPVDSVQAIDWRDRAYAHYRATLTSDVRSAIRSRIAAMPSPPLISVLVPTYDTPEIMLCQMLDSVCAQLYPHWQLCLADDASSKPHVRALLEDYAARDARIVPDFASENGGVSRATNRALALATGGFAVLLDHDDLLEEQALFRVAEAVLQDDPDMLYSDEVLVGEDGRTVQHFVFRPGFSPEYLRSHPYIVHLVGFRTSLLRELGGLDETLRISQDYDLILRASERARSIVHVPDLLCRWRIHGDSAGHAMIDRVMATSSDILRRHLQRCGEAGTVEAGPSFNYFDVRYPLQPGLKVAIIIPTRNHADLVRACIESIERTAGEVEREIVLIDHDSDDPVSLAYFASLRSRVKLLRYSGPFNFAAINNWAVSQLDGSHSHYLFCNNDVEAVEPGWLGRMLELGQKPDVGVVGAKLYYPDRRTIQHAGVAVPCCGIAENLGRFRQTSESGVDIGYVGSLICNREVSAVTAACMLVRRDVFEAIGGFDEALAVGYGDVDLCLRTGERGYRVMFCAHATLLHHESFTRGRSPEDPHPEDSARFTRRWQERLAAGDPYFNPNLSACSPNWQVADPLEFRLDIRRRVFVK